jgi:ATP-dependent Lon protease
MSEQETIRILPALPIKNTVLFPLLQMPLSIGRASSLAAVEAALASEEKQLVIVAQHDASVETPAQADLYAIGTRAMI